MAENDSIFRDVCMAEPVEVFQLIKNFIDDPFPQKVNLSVGAYRTDEGKPWVLPVVRTVESEISKDPCINHEYLPIAGLPDFRQKACELLLGKDNPAISQNRVEGIQAQGGTGCLRLAAEFFKRNMKADVVYISKPTWGGHKPIFAHAGFSQIREYRYWDERHLGIDFDGYCEDLKNAPEGAIVLLHAVGHNPTGNDPSEEQWMTIARIIQEKKLFPLLDCAYQGFASGDLEKDARAVRMFVETGMELFVAQSFSKTFGLYDERVGNLCIVAKSPQVLPYIRSQMVAIARTLWSNPSHNGARIVNTVLNSPTYWNSWVTDVKTMADRINQMRQLLFNKLRQKKAPGQWDHLVEQIGMFSYTGLTKAQSKHMVEKHHVYVLQNGRISMAGITNKNVEYVVDAIIDSINSHPPKHADCQIKQNGKIIM